MLYCVLTATLERRKVGGLPCGVRGNAGDFDSPDLGSRPNRASIFVAGRPLSSGLSVRRQTLTLESGVRLPGGQPRKVNWTGEPALFRKQVGPNGLGIETPAFLHK